MVAGLSNGVTWTADGALTFRDDVSAPNRTAVIALRDAFASGAFSKSELTALVANARWHAETGGMVSATFGPLLTDRETQSMLARTIQSIDLGLVTEPIKFKSPSGFVDLDRAALVAISGEVSLHVQAAFDTEAQVMADIDAGTVTAPEQITAAFA